MDAVESDEGRFSTLVKHKVTVDNSAENLGGEPLELAVGPELIFGLIAPIGVDLDLITEVLELTLHEMSYDVEKFRLTRPHAGNSRRMRASRQAIRSIVQGSNHLCK
jgi:hypothetical protein